MHQILTLFMNYISAENISKSYSEKILFNNLSIGISRGQKVAMVGVNGCGKTTLMNVLAGKETPDSGKVSVRNGVSVGYLGQNFDFVRESTIEANIFNDDNPRHKLIKDYDLAVMDPDVNPDYLQELMDKMDSLQAWDFEVNVKTVLGVLGIDDLERTMDTLSGGQLKRVALAKVLIEAPDLLIMDEPTNHLDIEIIEWLEQQINSNFQTVLMVTHDRYFLDNVANEILELDGGEIFPYKGNYAYFLEKKEEREQILASEVDKAKNQLRKEAEWMRRQPKARGTKAKYRIDAYHELKAKAASGKVEVKLDLDMKVTRQGGKILELEKLEKSYGDLKVVDDFSYIFTKGDKIGIVGKNGVGKSSFLSVLTGAQEPDGGMIDRGTNTVFGYFKQEDFSFNEDDRVIDVVKEIAEFIELPDGSVISASVFLTKFLFPPAMQYGRVGKLSGGERKRLQLLKVLITNPNFLILDEPTNDLDIMTLNVLEDFLQNFKGSLIIVSHDRYFMDNLVEHLFIFEGDGVINDFPGNYTDYRDMLDELEAEKQANLKSGKKDEPKVSSSNTENKKATFAEQKEYANLEIEIDKHEKEKHDLVNKLTSSGGKGFEELNDISKKIELITNQIDTKTLRWLELAEKM